MAVKNGQLPSSLLVRTSDGDLLVASAAASYERLNREFTKKFGKRLTITDGYRSLARQHDMFDDLGYPKAAYPGQSNHGLGIACDFGSGVNTYTSAEHRWMDTVGRRHGWIPLWESLGKKRNDFEPWHWVHVPSKDRYPFRKVSVNGRLDVATTFALQRALGRPVTDGSSAAGHLALWKAIQRRLNKRLAGTKGFKPLTVDGKAGPATIRALQTWLRRVLPILRRPKVDGVFGPNTVKALQRALNARRF
ncbi:D-alanyl-D-alanine carboxypeptidase family protein [Cellulomonas rhizosphaerae]|uniref:D-alanyl-D-alanine carboxypeptidase-like core domain-containing protein n=1 Tax=Cellulomonas rhizosphaerae TaxID=2293719 RepID=A0A413RNT3_9CELL|nr:D-alanyl-D-alanine carboxypeptidase family protein [Cellulomonas rhizosphaerae]RHA43679.1 hypothetical protein D1825_05190 [Cellulomonas rhizosphaerae]